MPYYNGAVREFGFYVDAKLPVTQKLTITAGLRWDGQWNPQPSHPNSAIPQTTSIPNDLSQWQPRLGVAWNPASNTVVRLSAGLYDAPTPADIFQRVFTDNGVNTVVADSYFDPQILPLVTQAAITRRCTAPPAGLTTPAALVVGIAPDFHNPRSFQVAGSVEQQINAEDFPHRGLCSQQHLGLAATAQQQSLSADLRCQRHADLSCHAAQSRVGQLLVNRIVGAFVVRRHAADGELSASAPLTALGELHAGAGARRQLQPRTRSPSSPH